ncbi:DNA-binding GntR family transcriptional regulator [Thermocatellispora tengchongensis]|uniref:DNA-binding GntR family transcriptional regulator n=1 Tax=Thermocatellispora tengchongensis TaxID=1073253 RepID=A0A840P0D7_9ACTN|nr:GntR family transcriptional regulator [Thermocatellispora tengchongensis]MBB5133188.1 DNA-binding GntR family transcriptional regulator [Thermocatellispora tengchongensis]
MLDYDGDTHLYLQVAEIIRRRIAEGDLASGDAIPSEAEIQQEFGIARTTARHAVRMLREQGLVYTVQGEGTFVGPPGKAPRSSRKTPMYQHIAKEIADRIKSGELRPRRPIPSETTLMQQYEVARETARRAVALLRDQGWVYTVPQRGSYVRPQEEWPEQ